MILEIAQIEIKAGSAQDFATAVTQARPIFEAAPGFIKLALQHCVEHPSRYLLLVQWASLEDHTEGFQKSEGFQQWRALVGHFFEQKPVVTHHQLVPTGD